MQRTSLNSASPTYQAWKARTSHMESVICVSPPRRVACSQAMLMFMRVQRMRPGLSSLKYLTSNDPIDGFSSRPMKNCRVTW